MNQTSVISLEDVWSGLWPVHDSRLTRPKARPGGFIFYRAPGGRVKVIPVEEKDPEPVFFDGESNLIIFVDSLAV